MTGVHHGVSDRVRLFKFRVELPSNQVIRDLYAGSEAEVCVLLEAMAPGLSAAIVRIDRAEAGWYLPVRRRTEAA